MDKGPMQSTLSNSHMRPDDSQGIWLRRQIEQFLSSENDRCI